MTGDILEECFREFRHSALKMETLPAYSVPGEAERIAAWREGRPRPERSVRTSSYLREVAGNVIGGRERGRLRILDHPLSEYARYQLAGYVESQAAGEEIRVAVRAGGTPEAARDLTGLPGDFWLFDAGWWSARAVLLRYDLAGQFTGSREADDAEVAQCTAAWNRAAQHSVSLNEYLAAAHLDAAAA